jgi:hypothetical protein
VAFDRCAHIFSIFDNNASGMATRGVDLNIEAASLSHRDRVALESWGGSL